MLFDLIINKKHVNGMQVKHYSCFSLHITNFNRGKNTNGQHIIK